ncbi:TonB-dependent copper receptor [Chromobacterium sp. ATCC 53434]|uniref:TonB-dependent copper receptor n=1 Tax=Chromobacterium sp. (strain ATCC 53434 / SC 14030) TaxID=2059672 RepID=UPI000C7616C8|nr:TonB-dependent copper receptor [Chromobacterium sp. ATCC 53434]AUH49586.1 TonB-dependent copper receptor [Chromobacterium sp. ATCC 53434]
MNLNPLLLPVPLALAAGSAMGADLPEFHADTIVVTAVRTEQPLRVETDPRAPRQPVPAGDGADLLKTIPGFDVVRKGGSSGDPLLRGLGGSRLNILANGGFVYGGCPGRMDPPTAYLFPDAYDKLVVIKGPQSVKYGGALIAGAVSFERRTRPFDAAGLRFDGSVLAGSAERYDGYADLTLGGPLGYLRLIDSHNQAGDYRDGDGRKVHSAYRRDSQSVVAGFTPGRDTTLELSGDFGRGRAAYADRMMDGSQFDRSAWGLKAEQRNLAPWLDAVRLAANHSYADHVMDNYSLRPLAPGRPPRASNPDRNTDAAKLEADLAFSDIDLTVGVDWQNDRHTSRAGGLDYAAQPRVADQHLQRAGLYAEGSAPLYGGKLVAGWRHDRVRAYYDAAAGRGEQLQDYRLYSGFARYEYKLGDWTPYAGVGVAERAPDYWERSYVAAGRPVLQPERNTQLDFGALYHGDKVSGSLSAYLGRIDDFLLVDRTAAQATRNVQAVRYGLEADASWQFAPEWRLAGSAAYSWGANTTDDRPLAQTPPLSATLSLAWDNQTWAAAAVWRVAAGQDRYAVGQGNIASQDLGPTPGFAVLSLNGGWRVSKALKLTAGIDNLLNRGYAEHVSSSGADVAGYQRALRVNEPGRTLWMKLQAHW